MELIDGQRYKLTLKKGSHETGISKDRPEGDYQEFTVEGVVRVFDHVERILDDDGYAISKDIQQKFEISTNDPIHPAIGFLPENVVEAKSIKMN